MNPLPPKPSLVEYTVDALRRDIENGTWPSTLPGERQLCERLQISRPTLRQALEKLEREGWILNQPGKRRKILKRVEPVSRGPERVVFLGPYPEQELEPFAIFEIEALRQKLAQAGVELEFQFSSTLTGRVPGRRLAERIAATHSSVWLLYRASRQAQAWFRRQQLPAVVMGSSVPEIGLPSVDVDFRATCRHAVHQLRQRGHRADRLTLLVPEGDLAGVADARAGFLEAAGTPSSTQVVVHGEGPEAVCRALDRVFRSRSRRPTGLLIQRPIYAHTVLGHLLSVHRLDIPGEVSVLALDDGPSLSFIRPEVTRYTKQADAFARRLFQLVEAVRRGAKPKTPQVRFMPELLPGATLGPGPGGA